MKNNTDGNLKISEPKLQAATNFIVKADTSSAWSLAAIVDELFLSMMDVKVPFCMLSGLTTEVRKQDLRNLGTGVLRRIYEEQARYKMYRIPIFRPLPVFVVHLKHLDDKLKQELSSLDRESKDLAMREAIDRVFEQVDRRFFLLSVKRHLRWRLES
jgi:hypothetical protein